MMLLINLFPFRNRIKFPYKRGAYLKRKNLINLASRRRCGPHKTVFTAGGPFRQLNPLAAMILAAHPPWIIQHLVAECPGLRVAELVTTVQIPRSDHLKFGRFGVQRQIVCLPILLLFSRLIFRLVSLHHLQQPWLP